MKFKDFLNEMDESFGSISVQDQEEIKKGLILNLGIEGGEEIYTKWKNSGETDFKTFLLGLIDDIKYGRKRRIQ